MCLEGPEMEILLRQPLHPSIPPLSSLSSHSLALALSTSLLPFLPPFFYSLFLLPSLTPFFSLPSLLRLSSAFSLFPSHFFLLFLSLSSPLFSPSTLLLPPELILLFSFLLSLPPCLIPPALPSLFLSFLLFFLVHSFPPSSDVCF